ncbi:hypothetical protein, partial [Nocardia brasiliensis]|uniref:hypothetical protein n=1 Tax=Nocardia brasiliensis TaxID=37326 RepID=UPI002454DBA5
MTNTGNRRVVANITLSLDGGGHAAVLQEDGIGEVAEAHLQPGLQEILDSGSHRGPARTTEHEV